MKLRRISSLLRRGAVMRRATIATEILLACSCARTISAQGTTPSVVHPGLAVNTVAEGLMTPATMAFTGPGDFFVVEKNTGQVKRINNGAVSTVLDLGVNFASERGLLGIALDPAFESNQFVYLYWTCRAPVPGDPFFPSLPRCSTEPGLGADTDDILAVPLLGNRVDRFLWNGTSLQFQQNLIMLRAFQNDGAPVPPGQGDSTQGPAGNHDGGVIRFGPDGKLYIIIGDVGRRGQMQNLPSGPTATGLGPTVPDDQFGGPEPDNAHFTGVIIRLNPDGSTPEDNPFHAAGAAIGGEAGANIQRIFSYGVRNSFGMSFDPLTGRLWTSENGDSSFDEINLMEAGSNSGWIQIMGPSGRLNEYKLIETHPNSFGLQQQRWLPTNIASSPAEAIMRLFQLPGSFFSEPEYSWKFATAPAAVGFSSASLGPEFAGDMFVGFSIPFPLGGPLYRMKLNAARTGFDTDDIVADNLGRADHSASNQFLIGTNFGVITDIQTGPDGDLYLVSLSNGAIYRISARTPPGCATDVTGQLQLNRGGFRFAFRTGRFVQTVTVTNTGASAIQGPVSLALSSLSGNASIANASGMTSCSAPAGSPFLTDPAGADSMLTPGESIHFVLEFNNPSRQAITYVPQVLAGNQPR